MSEIEIENFKRRWRTEPALRVGIAIVMGAFTLGALFGVAVG